MKEVFVIIGRIACRLYFFYALCSCIRDYFIYVSMQLSHTHLESGLIDHKVL